MLELVNKSNSNTTTIRRIDGMLNAVQVVYELKMCYSKSMHIIILVINK